MTMYQIFFAVSFACALFICTTYILLPGRRRYQGFLILINNIGLALYTGSSLIALPNPKKTVQCAADGLTEANWDNNTKCAVQGAMFVLGTHMCLWAALAIMINLHMNVVWRSKLLERYSIFVYSAIILISVALTVIPAVQRDIEAQPGFLCAVSADVVNQIFFYPQSVAVGGILLLHIATGSWMFAVSRRVSDGKKNWKKWVRKQIRMQWRPAAFTALSQAAWFAFFVVYRTNYDKIKNHVTSETPWIRAWVFCILQVNSTEGPAKCQSIAAPYIPGLAGAAFGVSIGILIGVFNSLVLISPQIMREWREYLGFARPISRATSLSSGTDFEMSVSDGKDGGKSGSGYPVTRQPSQSGPTEETGRHPQRTSSEASFNLSTTVESRSPSPPATPTSTTPIISSKRTRPGVEFADTHLNLPSSRPVLRLDPIAPRPGAPSIRTDKLQYPAAVDIDTRVSGDSTGPGGRYTKPDGW
ncbi:hypothetical protein SpCBS45565_g01194 [Spizellomyces sp. 'palustris']|nr:hypothetical protein SpCBS45565_g01194 [Spizellomyces sp. 'palustris']